MGIQGLLCFYSRDSQYPIDQRIDDLSELADIYRLNQALQIERAILFAVPIPEEFALPMAEMENPYSKLCMRQNNKLLLVKQSHHFC